MAKLYFRYGAMGCSKTANALMVAFNYEEKGLTPLVLKPRIDNRDGERIIKSRIGLQRECSFVDEYIFIDNLEKTQRAIYGVDCIIVDEVQFCKPEEVHTLWEIVNLLKIPVICYGLLTDFRLQVFEASEKLMVLADVKEELKTVCWCGDGARCNTRIDEKGNVIRDGAQVLLGGNDTYVSLCVKHYEAGDLGPKMRAKYEGIQ